MQSPGSTLAPAISIRGAPSCPGPDGAFPGRWEFYSRAASFGKADGNRLFGAARSMLAFANMMDCLTHKLAGLRGGSFALPSGLACFFQCSFFWHTFVSVRCGLLTGASTGPFDAQVMFI